MPSETATRRARRKAIWSDEKKLSEKQRKAKNRRANIRAKALSWHQNHSPGEEAPNNIRKLLPIIDPFNEEYAKYRSSKMSAMSFLFLANDS